MVLHLYVGQLLGCFDKTIILSIIMWQKMADERLVLFRKELYLGQQFRLKWKVSVSVTKKQQSW